ncbi:acetolactate synthase, large subunit [Fodinibius roseus]|uniref:Acetolactate synthase, large subunit n=1 Tax=Fodinibius roseus TaxID=1194090 RepID=A0A1M5ENZ9_9BACT|nr:acetolactate synthase large subunit [Fodinibius roseus]SHF81023.1 acetolactate synthase, large subunit [Fodinibius roseus]
MNVAEFFVECLETEGVTHIFGVPGEENEALLFALDSSTIEFVPCRHEQGAAFIANVWGRLTGEPGVCLSTLGPGATNLITGVADANLDKAPLVAITAQGGLDRLHNESHQMVDVVNMFRPITKWNGNIPSPRVVAEVVRKAFKIAGMEKPGATHIELSEDVAGQEISSDFLPIKPGAFRRPGSDYKAIRNTLNLLQDARKPLVLAGNGAIRKRASNHLTEFVTRHNIPVVSTFMGKGAVSDRLSQSLFSIGLGFKDYVLKAVEEADLVLAIGYDIAEYPPQEWNPGGDKPIVHIDFDPAEVYTHYNPKVEVTGDISAALWELNEQLNDSDLAFTNWYAPIRKRIREDIQSYRLQEDEPFTVPGVLLELRDTLDDGALLISDVGTHKMWVARNYPTYCPNGCIISNGLASMGIALPGGIAAGLLNKGRQIVSVMGDGGFMMNSQELETAKRLGVGYINIVFNDNDYGLISWKQFQHRQQSVSTGIQNPDFRKYAKSFGIQGYKPENLSELRSTLKQAVEHKELCLIEVPISTHVNNELTEKLKNWWNSH